MTADHLDQPALEPQLGQSVSSITDSSLEIEIACADRVNFAMQQNGVPLVERVSITNSGTVIAEGVNVTISLENDECDTWSGRIDRIEPDHTHHLDTHELTLRAKDLATRTEAERTSLLVEVATASGPISKRAGIEILAFDQWPGVGYYPELLAAFITPNHPNIAEMLTVARQSMREQSSSDALDGYQSGSRQRAALLAEACFNAVLTRGIGYINPPASFEQNGQRIRLVDRIVREGFGSCLDLSLLLASLWEQVGLHPLVLLLEGHAIPAVWTRETHLPEPAIDEPARIRNFVELGEIVPVESTLVTQSGADFGAAVAAARKRLNSPGSGFCAVDVRSARKRGIRPLPLRSDGDATQVDLDQVRPAGTPAVADTTLDRVTLADRAESGSFVTSKSREGETSTDRVERWRSRLLDLSLRNRLISFRESGRTLRLNVPDVAMLEDMLADGKRFTINPKTDGGEAYLKQELQEANLYASETVAETQKGLLTLSRAAKQSIEETGANILHLAIGMLKWFESESSQEPRRAPLILLPVKLDRKSSGSGYRYDLSLSEEPLRPNVTLLEKLRQSFGIDTTGLDDFPEDASGIDVPQILRRFRHAIRETSRWEVEESVVLGLFSFNKFLMWRDLKENMDRLRKNRLVAHLVDREHKTFDPNPFPRPDDLDDSVPPGEMFCTRDADSSQMAAIRAAAEGRTFVLEGPPGTGKSQTIANIIADSIGRGKRVLFVAEKMAALSVVSRRLAEDGLRPFCLELHSAKASKKEVLAQLQEALEVATTREPPDWKQVCEEVGVTRKQLNSYVRELHKPRATGESLYRVLGRMCTLGHGLRAALPVDNVERVTKDQLGQWRDQLVRIETAAETIDPASDHPLRGIGRSEWSFTFPTEAREAIATATTSIQQLRDRLKAFLTGIGASHMSLNDLSRDAIHVIAVFASWLPQSPSPHPDLLTGKTAPRTVATLLSLIEHGKSCDATRSELLATYREEFLDLDHKAKLQSIASAMSLPKPLAWISGFFARGKFKSVCNGSVPSLETLRADLEKAKQLKVDAARLSPFADAAPLLGSAWNGAAPDWDALDRLLKWCQQFHQAIDVLRRVPGGESLIENLAAAASSPSTGKSPEPKALVAAWKDWNQVWSSNKKILETSGAEAFSESLQSGWLSAAEQVFERWLNGLSQLNDWCTWRRARLAAAETGLAPVIEQYERGELKRLEIADAFERSFGEAWFNTVASSVETIQHFNANTHNTSIKRFRLIDQQLIEQTRYAVSARLNEGLPPLQKQASAQSEIGILKREIEKKSRHLPTRRLIETIPNLLPRLKPCFLMSPLSIAQYLDPKLPPFDLVVFDEASQIPVWDAIGAIARGTDVIVVGDSRQLPPTNFFNTMEGDDEDAPVSDEYVVEDMDSILKECRAAQIPPLDLKWHYRSRHESLIAFSNYHYYDNKLHTFPSPEERSPSLGVTLRHVPDGIYDRGKSRTNRVEAEQVVDQVVQLLQADEPGSIGVVTFNLSQQGLIDDLLDTKRREMPDIEKYFTNEVREPVFVKNLESVQGDERDTIIFSVGFGPDEHGKVSMNFGPLNQDGGERRLNVAVTRARERLIVFSALLSDQIDTRRTMALGVKHFKTFLDYANRGPQAIAEATQQSGMLEFDSSFEQAVWQALTEKGFDVDTQVGCAGYRVDLAVRDPEHPGRYLIGIECDGAAYHSAKTARDRDRLRQTVLENLNWRITRVWSTDWWINRQRCLERLLGAIEAAKEPKAAAPVEFMPVEVQPPRQYASHAIAESEPTRISSSHAQYRCAVARDRALRRLDFFEPRAAAVAVNALNEIVRTEAPIIDELAMRRLASWFENRVTDRFRSHYRIIRSNATRQQQIKFVDGMLWGVDQAPEKYFGFRVPGAGPDDCRDLEMIPLIERANAVVHVVQEQFGLPREALEREASRVLGTSRVTSRVKELIGEAIDQAIKQRRIYDNDGQVCLA